VPKLATAAVKPAFEDLLDSIPSLNDREESMIGADFDWALHPGGSTIISGVQKAMNLPEDALMASFEVYTNYGNSSSATIMSVMDKLRRMPGGKENVISCAFGPGVVVEMMVMKRRNIGMIPSS